MSVLAVTKATMQSEVIDSNQTVLLDFWAPWCGPCRMLSPVVDQIAQERPQLKVVKVNVDEEPELAMDYAVMSIPTLLVIRGGKVVNKAVGVLSKAAILDMVL